MNWDELYYELDDADLVIDRKIGDLINWQGGLSRLVVHNLQSCQALGESIVPFGTKGVILLSGALFGESIPQIESLLKERLWSSVLIITATSGASHLILHGAESDFTVTEVFEQFLARATEWCGAETKLRAFGAPGLELFNFGEFGASKIVSVIDKQTPRLK